MVGTKNCVHPKYAKAVVLKQLFWWPQATYQKPQVCLCLYCTKEAGLLYTSFSQKLFISKIWTCMDSQLIPTTLNENTQTCQFTNNTEERRLGSHVDMKTTGQFFTATGNVWGSFLFMRVSIWAHTKNVPIHFSIYVVVPDRNRILFRRIFWVHHWVWRTIALSFRWERGSYTLHRCIRYSCIYTLRMSPALSGS